MNRLIVISVFATILATPAMHAATVDVDQPAVCYTCHPGLEELNKKKSVHGIFAAGECSSCHNPHASSHASLLYEDKRELCMSCHDEYSLGSMKAHRHEPAGVGDCMSCHDPHASDHSNLLKKDMTSLCTECHASVATWMNRTNVHAPAASEECASCHDPHSAENDGLLTQSVPTLCFDCHESGPDFERIHGGYKVSDANCVTCHDAHASNEKSLLMSIQHGPFKADKCDACHAPSTSGQSAFALTGSVEEVCTKCHVNIKSERNKEFHHNLDDERSCIQCHNPHAAPVSPLLSAKESVMCSKCHFVGAQFAKPREAYLTHDGLDCSNCHSPHGSDNAQYFKADGINLCSQCHEDAHRSSHPIGDEVIDPRTEEPVTCLSCHQLHGADFEQYLPLNPRMELCIQCHRR